MPNISSVTAGVRVLQCTSHIRTLRRQPTPTLGHKMWKFALMVPVLAVAAAASAEPCVKVRDGTDGTGPSGGYMCMRFNEAERRAAAKLRLQFASPYQAVRAQMSRNGWMIDPAWLRDVEPEATLTSSLRLSPSLPCSEGSAQVVNFLTICASMSCHTPLKCSHSLMPRKYFRAEATSASS